MFRFRRRRRVRRRAPSAHYLKHKEAARSLVHERLAHLNAPYGLVWGRIAIKNTRRSWGSCSELKNLNFHYRILFLPPHLRDYLIVHELCHLAELNHSKRFWALVARVFPDHRALDAELRRHRGLSR